MKKTFKILIIMILFFGLSSLKAFSTVLSSNEVKSIISQNITRQYKDYTDAEMEIKVAGLPFKELYLPEGHIHFEVKTNCNKFMPRSLNEVAVYVNGRLIKTFNAPTINKAYKDVLIATSPIEREKSVNIKNVKIERKEISNNYNYALTTDYFNNKELIAKKYIAEGEILDKRFVKIKPDILRNSHVTACFNTNDLTVSIDAIALSDGEIGDEICILNKDYNKIYKGTVIGGNKVLIKI